MKKKKLLLMNIATLLISAFMLINFTYAWIVSNKYVDQLIFQTGEGKAEIKGYLFKQDKDGLVQSTPDIEATQQDDGNGQLHFRFVDEASIDMLDLGDLYYGEHSLNKLSIPSYFVEIQVHTLIPQSYVRFNLSSLSYGSGETNPNFNDFEFRYAVKNGNDHTTPIEFITPISPFLQDLQNQNGTPFVVNTQYELGNGTTGGIFQINVPAQYRTIYEQNFALSLVVQVAPRPLQLINFIKNSTNKGESNASVGMKLMLDVDYSAIAFVG